MGDLPQFRTSGFLVAADGGRPLPAAGGVILAGSADTAGRFSLLRSHSPALDRVSLHVHRDMDECFYVLDGDYSIECGGETFDATTGSFVFLPRGVPHAYTVGPLGGTKLILAVPGGIEDFFTDLDAGMSLDELEHRHAVSFRPQ